MKYLIATFLYLLSVTVFAANPTYNSFLPADFTNNGTAIGINPSSPKLSSAGLDTNNILFYTFTTNYYATSWDTNFIYGAGFGNGRYNTQFVWTANVGGAGVDAYTNNGFGGGNDVWFDNTIANGWVANTNMALTGGVSDYYDPISPSYPTNQLADGGGAGYIAPGGRFTYGTNTSLSNIVWNISHPIYGAATYTAGGFPLTSTIVSNAAVGNVYTTLNSWQMMNHPYGYIIGTTNPFLISYGSNAASDLAPAFAVLNLGVSGQLCEITHGGNMILNGYINMDGTFRPGTLGLASGPPNVVDGSGGGYMLAINNDVQNSIEIRYNDPGTNWNAFFFQAFNNQSVRLNSVAPDDQPFNWSNRVYGLRDDGVLFAHSNLVSFGNSVYLGSTLSNRVQTINNGLYWLSYNQTSRIDTLNGAISSRTNAYTTSDLVVSNQFGTWLSNYSDMWINANIGGTIKSLKIGTLAP